MSKKISIIILCLIASLGFGQLALGSEATGSLDTGLDTGIEGVLKVAPTASPAAGGYNADQTVALTASSSSAICYTTDGTTPACATSTTCTTGTVYSSAISVTSTTTIKSIACYADATSGSVSSDTYTLTCATSSVANGTVAAYSDCSITCDSGYSLSGNECIAQGGGYPGGGGGDPPPPTPTPPMPTTTTGGVTATVDGGGKTTVTTDDNTEASVRIPANAVEATTEVTITPVTTTDQGVFAIVADTPTGQTLVGDYLYDYSAVSDGETITSFSKYVTITMTYTTVQIAGLKESSLAINYWDDDAGEWVALATTVNKSTNTLTARVLHFTYLVIFGEEGVDIDVDLDEDKPISEMTNEEIRARIAEIMALIVQLQAQLAELIGGEVEVPSGFTFDSDLKLGDTGSDVKYLQITLNSDPDTKIASSGVGSPGEETNYFGNLTKVAVIKFQEKYYTEVLEPWGFDSGTGIVGPTTREKLNDILGQ